MLQAGADFAGYQVEGVLGQGGMGTVYLARHPRLPRSVALKLLNREFSVDQELQRRFEREADVVAQLDHPEYRRGVDFTATLAYASPEQLSGEIVDHRSDQYSLACALFAMHAGHPPYTATNPGQVVAGHLSQPVPRLTTVRTDLPPAVDGVIARAMAKRRDERFGSATEFTDVLRDALEGRHVVAPTVRQPWTDPAHPGSRAPVNTRSGHGRTPPSSGTAPMDTRSGLAPRGTYRSPPRRRMAPADRRSPGGDARNTVCRLGTRGCTRWRQAVRGSRPRSAAAFFVGIVTLLFSLSTAAFLIYGITETLDEIDRGKDPSGSFIAIAILTVVVAFTGSGAVLLLCARTAGRVMSIITAVLVGLFARFGVIGSAVGEVYAATAASAAVFVLSAALVGFAASSSTGRWIRYRKAVRASRRR
ncbi:hypothetical protein ACFWUP_12170 [Nocardia sp. NPDC058658]|uniref:hypothetical protein n=1 Tax=Nocardia sp. NPDC058658 TaxID=3346580 RepID=UPI00365537A6